MVSSSEYDWTTERPNAYEVVTAYFPETATEETDDWVKLRPCLIMNVNKGRTTGTIALKIAYGTRKLKFPSRGSIDLIIQNSKDLDDIGLPCATRFDLDNTVTLPWTHDYFGCWPNRVSPYIGSLTEFYIKEYAYRMMMRTKPGE